MHQDRVPPGYCNYSNIIYEGLGRCPANGISVELGVYFGQSSYVVDRYLRQTDRTSHQHFGIDSWDWTATPEELNKPDKVDGSYIPIQLQDNIRPYKHVMKNHIIPNGLYETINFIKADSAKSSELFDDESIDFIFIFSITLPYLLIKQIVEFFKFDTQHSI